MGNLSNGILGSFAGSVGPVTGYIRNGRNIIRSSSSVVVYKPTPLREAQLQKIKICSQFTGCFTGTGFFNKSFPAYGNTGSGYNRATSALMNQAICGVYPNQYLGYPLVLISKGKLPGAVNASAASMGSDTIQFLFDDNSNVGTASATDTVLLVAYVETLNQAVFTLNGGLRKDGMATLEVPFFAGYIVETWIGFLNKAATDSSDSVYTGQVVM